MIAPLPCQCLLYLTDQVAVDLWCMCGRLNSVAVVEGSLTNNWSITKTTLLLRMYLSPGYARLSILRDKKMCTIDVCMRGLIQIIICSASTS